MKFHKSIVAADRRKVLLPAAEYRQLSLQYYELNTL